MEHKLIEDETSEVTLDDIVKEEKLTLLPVIKYPNAKLSVRATEVTDFDEDHSIFIKNLLYTMKINNAISISATSVGSPMNLMLINIRDLLVMFNPIMVAHSKQKTKIQEGTISIPGFFYNTDRYETIDIVYRDDTGKRIQAHITGLSAAVVQHELDILDGKLYIDNMKLVKKFFEQKKIKNHIKRHNK